MSGSNNSSSGKDSYGSSHNSTPMSWRAFAGNAAARAKEYVVSKEYKNTYDQISNRVAEKIASRDQGSNPENEEQHRSGGGLHQWARQRMQRMNSGGGSAQVSMGVEKVYIFPGWAVRRYHDDTKEDASNAPFDIDVFISGYASAIRPPELATRSQKVFMALAKRYAALPKLPLPSEIDGFTSNQAIPPRLSKSTEDLLQGHKLPPTPSEMTEDREMAELDAQFQKAEQEVQNDSQSIGYSPPPSPTLEPTASLSEIPLEKLRQLHHNLNTRLEPFWSTALSQRTIKVSVWASEPPSSKKEVSLIDFGDEDASEHQPLATQDVVTTAQGSFQHTVNVPWDTLCTHPKALHVAFGDNHHSQEYPLFLRAELLPLPTSDPPEISTPPAEASTSVNLTHALLRVISDIDDTVKLSNVLGGAKKVFHNVFVNELESLVISSMSDWYQRMWSRGVRFHYVSNAPVALLPVINEFIQVSSLPIGSVKLKSYNSQSLFNGLLASPLTRKRQNVLDVLNNFTTSRFVLIGDSGEQDLELYAALARERPEQILGIFIRDVSTTEEPLTDPTGCRWQEGLQDDILHLFPNPNATDASSTPYKRYVPRKQASLNSPISSQPTSIQGMDAFKRTSSPVTSRIPGNIPPSPSEPNVNLQSLPLPTRRRVELQMRVNKARDEIPRHIKLRVFRDALECTEAEEILGKLDL